jgi:tRNA pseudouridine13 synthase
MSLPDWPRAHGQPLFAALLRHRKEDFDVTEELGFELSGDGEHDFLFVEKTGVNTEWLARQLASFAAVPAKDVGYSGLKDRHAVARQWFSIPRWKQPDWATLQVDGVRLLEIGRNARKLRRGAHKNNHFKIVLRNVPEDSNALAAVDERLQSIRKEGVPNYFGEQRFGRGGGNVALANQWASGRRLPRHKRSIAISSARSYLFNELLAARVSDATWNTLVAGDVANLDGSGSVFDVAVPDDELCGRCRELDIHPTALLWGDGLALESAPPGHEDWLLALAKARVQPARRSLRLKVLDLQWQVDRDSLTLSFGLTRGAFATSVVRELASCTDFANNNPSEGTHHESP